MVNTVRSRREGESGGSTVDVPFVVGYVALASYVLVETGPSTSLVFGTPLLFFLPGYALLSVLFPRGRARAETGTRIADAGARAETRPNLTSGLSEGHLGWRARVALSVGTSVSLLPLFALALAAAGVGFESAAIVGSLALFTVTGMFAGLVRRWRLQTSDLYVVPFRRWWGELASAANPAEGREATLNLALVFVIVLAMSGVTYAVVSPPDEESYTEVALLTSEGENLVAGNYTRNLSRGGESSVAVSIENQEGEQVNYTLVTQLERVRTDNGSFTVLERDELDRTQIAVDDGQTRYLNQTVSPTMLGQDLRLSYYLYKGAPPERVGPGTTDHHLYLWVDVDAGGPGQSGDEQ